VDKSREMNFKVLNEMQTNLIKVIGEQAEEIKRLEKENEKLWNDLLKTKRPLINGESRGKKENNQL